MLIISPEILEDGTLNSGLIALVCRITATLLIPDPIASKMLDPALPENWIWDQSLLTVEINTITRWAVKGSPNVT